ncbi:MAG: hypothetical protein FWG83_06565 [Oscillospiraceae bacterium]|nr:hypothetical protein [Oscillospiraceae bacterium]
MSKKKIIILSAIASFIIGSTLGIMWAIRTDSNRGKEEGTDGSHTDETVSSDDSAILTDSSGVPVPQTRVSVATDSAGETVTIFLPAETTSPGEPDVTDADSTDDNVVTGNGTESPVNTSSDVSPDAFVIPYPEYNLDFLVSGNTITIRTLNIFFSDTDTLGFDLTFELDDTITDVSRKVLVERTQANPISMWNYKKGQDTASFVVASLLRMNIPAGEELYVITFTGSGKVRIVDKGDFSVEVEIKQS